MAQATMAAMPGLKETYVQLKTRMDKAVEDFRREMSATRTGRANVHMLDTVSVDYYGTITPLNQLATVHAEAQMITVQAWDTSQLGAIEKAIRSADLGDRKSTRLNSSHSSISYAVFCLKKKKKA